MLGLITLPIITWYFSREDIGRLAILNAFVSLSTLFFSLGLDQAYVREFHETRNKPALFKLTIAPGLLSLLISLTLLLSSNNVISFWLFELDSHLLSALVAILVLCTFICRFLSLILRMRERGLAYSMSQILPRFLMVSIIGSYALFSLEKNITNLVLATTISVSVTCAIYGWSTRREWFASLKETVDYKYVQRLLNFGFPLIFSGLAFWGLTTTDKLLLKELASFDELGLYSVTVSFAAAATIFQTIFTTVWVPTVYKWAAEGEKIEKIVKVNRYILLAVIVLFCATGLFSWITVLILPDSYKEVQWILVACLGFPLFYTLSESTGVGIGISRRSGFAMMTAFISFILNIIGSYLLIPHWGAAGAAASTCASFWLFFIIKTEFSIYLWHPIPRVQQYSYSTILAAGAVFNCFYGELYPKLTMFYWLLILSSIFFFFNKEIEELRKWALANIFFKSKYM